MFFLTLSPIRIRIPFSHLSCVQYLKLHVTYLICYSLLVFTFVVPVVSSSEGVCFSLLLFTIIVGVGVSIGVGVNIFSCNIGAGSGGGVISRGRESRSDIRPKLRGQEAAVAIP